MMVPASVPEQKLHPHQAGQPAAAVSPRSPRRKRTRLEAAGSEAAFTGPMVQAGGQESVAPGQQPGSALHPSKYDGVRG